jgi:hypothetical protein
MVAAWPHPGLVDRSVAGAAVVVLVADRAVVGVVGVVGVVVDGFTCGREIPVVLVER